MAYNVGDLVRASVVFKNSAGTATDPTVVTARYQNVTGGDTSLTYPTDGALVKDSAGNYHVDIDCTAGGTWYFRFAGTGAVQSAAEGSFVVDTARLA